MEEKRSRNGILACVVCSICLLIPDFHREGCFQLLAVEGREILGFFAAIEGRRKPIPWVVMGEGLIIP